MRTLPSRQASDETQGAFTASLVERGWANRSAPADVPGALLAELKRIAEALGRRVPGRAGSTEETLVPRTAAEAHPKSLSARYGLDALPFHTELSHRPRPCRYLLLGCLDPGSPGAVTLMLDWRGLGFSVDELDLLASAPILARSGRRSFYTTLLSAGRSFLRWDPGCLEAVDPRGRSALELVERRLADGRPVSHRWRRGDILLIDNWRVLHGRGRSGPASGRRLARILIDA